MWFYFFETGDIEEISNIADLDNFLLLCGNKQSEVLEVLSFISDILASL